MEPQAKTSKWQIIAKFSLIYSLVIIALNLVLFILGMQMQMQTLNTLVMLAAVFVSIYFGIVSRRDNTLDGYITYGQGVGTGMLISLMAGIIVTIYTQVFISFIDPDFMQNMLNEAKRKMIEDGRSEEQIEVAMEWTKKIMGSPIIMAVMGILTNLFYGLIASLILAYFTKRINPDSQYNSL